MSDSALNAQAAQARPALIVRAGTRTAAIPLQYVAETMRPLTIEPVAGTPSFVLGLSMIRGAPMPVVDLRALLEGNHLAGTLGRFVTVKVAERYVAVGVDAVVGLRTLEVALLADLPALLKDAESDLIEAIGTCDAQLLVVLRASRLVPDAVWIALAASGAAR